jgi:thioredoxin 1
MPARPDGDFASHEDEAIIAAASQRTKQGYFVMPFDAVYRDDEPTRDEIDRSQGTLLLEFGAGWCGHCLALAPTVEEVLRRRPDIGHLRIADGRGKPLGRSFRVKLWPTLVLLQEGQVIAQLVRPTEDELRRAFDGLPAGNA